MENTILTLGLAEKDQQINNFVRILSEIILAKANEPILSEADEYTGFPSTISA